MEHNGVHIWSLGSATGSDTKQNDSINNMIDEIVKHRPSHLLIKLVFNNPENEGEFRVITNLWWVVRGELGRRLEQNFVLL